MRQNKFLTTLFVLGVSTLLSGCLGSNGGGGGPTGTSAPGGGTTGGGTTGGGTTGGGTTGGGMALSGAEFDAKNLEYIFLQPTAQPITGSANYAGRVSVLTGANAANSAEAVYGDANMNINFGSGVENPITGTVGNFAGPVNGVDTVVTGTLSTANALSNDVNEVTSTVTNVATLTSATATFRGDLSDPSGTLTGSARMILNGNFKDEGGTKLSGGHQTTIFPTGEDTSIATGGSFYADVQ